MVDQLRNGPQLAYGHIDFEESIIQISTADNVGHQHMCETMLHEVLHGILYSMNQEIENEEEIVETLGRGLYMFLQDNGGRIFDIKK